MQPTIFCGCKPAGRSDWTSNTGESTKFHICLSLLAFFSISNPNPNPSEIKQMTSAFAARLEEAHVLLLNPQNFQNSREWRLFTTLKYSRMWKVAPLLASYSFPSLPASSSYDSPLYWFYEALLYHFGLLIHLANDSSDRQRLSGAPGRDLSHHPEL